MTEDEVKEFLDRTRVTEASSMIDDMLIHSTLTREEIDILCNEYGWHGLDLALMKVKHTAEVEELRGLLSDLRSSHAGEIKELQAEKAELERKLEVQQLRADNAVLKAELAQARGASMQDQDQATAHSAAMLDLEQTVQQLQQTVQQQHLTIKLKDKHISKLMAGAGQAKLDESALVDKLVDIGL